MKNKVSLSRKIFITFNYLALVTYALLCVLPVINIAAISLSSTSMADAGAVKLLPKEFTLASYKYVFLKPDFLIASFVSLKRVLFGVVINMVLTVITAYPLSKRQKDLHWRTGYCWFFVITMLFNGGLIPLYMMITSLKLTNSIWALILPGALPVFNLILLINFFRQIPEDYADAASIDGANHWTILWKMYVPMSTPVLATLTLFVIVGHWNSWFDGIIYMNDVKKYPLQSYLQTVVINISDASRITIENLKDAGKISDKTIKAARIFLAALPVMLIYIPLQKYFVKGVTLGGIKG